ncbi:hypothetical protein Nocox_21145 [Nonomuraea coxensis DSM 45129]|uniref:CBS domain-containing protein n=1 Tax=Nonomuraea coxensis DSM 45129 TaxID=1122611 RepID=A0ABX8U2A1_9ACTN|nr:CBS domain-containing protein [Nonomuraea coxensis]QYC41835.1 hypothetical protein Nocox_21145 [Nonomuraea coxensis DSM 45129]
MSIEVQDVMGRAAVAVPADASFAGVVAAMERFTVGAVTVTDAGLRATGVVSEDDLLLKEIGQVRQGVVGEVVPSAGDLVVVVPSLM